MLLTLERRTITPAARVYEDRLSVYEKTRWNEITRHLGSLAATEVSETPIWDEMTAKYPSLDLISRPVSITETAPKPLPKRQPAIPALLEGQEDYGSLIDFNVTEKVLAGLRRL